MSRTGSEVTLERALALDRQVLYSGVAYLLLALTRQAIRVIWGASGYWSPTLALRWTELVVGLAMLVAYVLVVVALCRASTWLGNPATPIAVWFSILPFLGLAAIWAARALHRSAPLAGSVLRVVALLVVVVAPAVIWLYVKRQLSSRIRELSGLSP